MRNLAAVCARAFVCEPLNEIYDGRRARGGFFAPARAGYLRVIVCFGDSVSIERLFRAGKRFFLRGSGSRLGSARLKSPVQSRKGRCESY